MADNGSYNPNTEPEIGYGQLLAILIRRSGWLVTIFGAALVVAAFITWRERPQYQSSMQLLVEPNYEQRLGEGATQYQLASEQDYATQLNLMRSRQFVEETVDLLQPEYPDLSIETIRESLILYQLEETKIFQVDYISDDALKTQRVLETLQQVYLDYNLEQQEQRLRRGLATINEQLQVVREDLSQSQVALKRFREEQNLIDPEQQAGAATEALNNIIQEQQALQTEYQDLQSRYATLQQQLALSPESALVASRLSQSARYQTLLNQLQETELLLADRRAIFTDEDPGVQALLEQRQNQLGLLSQEIERIFGEVPPQLQVDGEALLSTSQLSESDLSLVNALAEAQVGLNGLRARQQSLSQTEQRLRAELNRFPDLIAEYDRLRPELDIERAVLEQLLQQQQQLSAELVRGGFNWQVVEPPQIGWKIGPDPQRNMLLGAVVGLFLGGIAAFIREAMDDLIRDVESLKRQSNLPLLGTLPRYQLGSTFLLPVPRLRPLPRTALSLIQMVQNHSFRESFDLIYKNVQLLSAKERQLRSLMITSARANEGKSLLSLGLAISAARLHQRVLLIDADFRHPSLHSELGLSDTQGLSFLLENQDAIPNPVSVMLADVRIDVLPAGLVPVDPVRLLSSPRVKELMDRFEATYDLVILDTSPVLGVVDAIQVASVCDGVVLVSRLNHVTRSAFQDAVTMLYSLNLLGVIANESRIHPSSHVPLPNKESNLPFHFSGLIETSTNNNLHL
ncbi:MAG: polysaccharide biosynthesis tyrosine autokinase [Elainellaceae cyanobacterium]